MANNGVPPEVFNPRPELAERPTLLVRLGIFTASTALLAVLSPPPGAGLLQTEYAFYVFYVSLAMLFLLGMGLIVLGWFTADAQEGHNVLTRIAIRLSQLMLVVAVAMYEIYRNP